MSTARLVEWLRNSAPQCLLVAASSAAVYGAEHVGPISEGATLAPMSPYGNHKLLMEQMCRSYSLSFAVRCVVVRLFSVYGPNLRKQLLWDICSRLQCGGQTLTLAGMGTEVRDWTDVRDVARLLVGIGEFPHERNYLVINGGSGRGTSVAEIAKILVSNWGGDTALRFTGIARSGDPVSLLADDTALRRMEFDWRIPLERGLTDYVNWFKSQVCG